MNRRSKKTTGFVGWVTHRIKDKESEWNKTTCIMAKFAEYADIGGNRTQVDSEQLEWCSDPDI